MPKLPVEIGRLDHRITIQKKTVETDSHLNQYETWNDFHSCWAAVSGVSNREYFAARQQNEENVVSFKLRGCARLKELNKLEYRIVFDGCAYDINYIDDVRLAGSVINIKAVRYIPKNVEDGL